MQDGVIPTSRTSFACQVTRPLQDPVLPSTPGHHGSRLNVAPPSAPRRSTWLAKKARSRAPALVAAHNVVMKKLCISTEPSLEMVDFERYINLFNDGLTEAQVKLIKELFLINNAVLAKELDE
jgi:hypothetical protein